MKLKSVDCFYSADTVVVNVNYPDKICLSAECFISSFITVMDNWDKCGDDFDNSFIIWD